MKLEHRLKQLKKNINSTKGMRPRKLEDYFCGTLKNTYVPNRNGKKLEDYF
jgi:hypothetical protein